MPSQSPSSKPHETFLEYIEALQKSLRTASLTPAPPLPSVLSTSASSSSLASVPGPHSASLFEAALPYFAPFLTTKDWLSVSCISKNVVHGQRISLPFRDRMFWNEKYGYAQANFLQSRGAEIVGVSFIRLRAERGDSFGRPNARVDLKLLHPMASTLRYLEIEAVHTWQFSFQRNDMRAIAKCCLLQKLVLTHINGPFNLEDVGKNLKQLHDLRIHDVGPRVISDLNPLKGLAKLKMLNLDGRDGDGIFNLAPLANLLKKILNFRFNIHDFHQNYFLQKSFRIIFSRNSKKILGTN